jgi:Spy/CpxP family protein refolding chaperone
MEMKLFTKNKIIVTLVVLLLLANTATLVGYWALRFRDHRASTQPHVQPSQYLIESLGMDKVQQEKYLALVKEHQDASHALRNEIRTSKEKLFQLLNKSETPDSLVEQAAGEAGRSMQALDLLTFRHFREVRKICTPRQQETFDQVIHEMLEMMSPGGRPGPPGKPGTPPPGRPPGREHGPMPDGPPPME